MSTTPCTNSAALLASLVALVATMRTAVAPAPPDRLGVLGQHAQRAGQGQRGDPAGGVHALAEPDDLHPALYVGQLAAGQADVGDEQPQRVRPAVDGRHPAGQVTALAQSRGPGLEVIHRAARRWARRRRPGPRRGPRPGRPEVRVEVGVGDARARRPPRTSRLDGLPAERVAAGHGELVRDERVQALDAVRHAARAGRGGRERLQARGLRRPRPGGPGSPGGPTGSCRAARRRSRSRSVMSRMTPAASSRLTAAAARGQVR